jgi:oxygen-independent coproporphyrinogen-3 oxidase
MGEFMMTGLRLTREGVSPQTFRERFGQEMDDVFGSEIEDLIKLGLLERLDSPLLQGDGVGEVPRGGMRERVRLTRRGRLLGNQVFMRFVG